ncbi:hypothetical protein ABZP36_017709 [Zizania latifolia]
MDAAGPPPPPAAGSVEVGGGNTGAGTSSFLGLPISAAAAASGLVVFLVIVAAATAGFYARRRRNRRRRGIIAKPLPTSRVEHAPSSGSLCPTSTPKEKDKDADAGSGAGGGARSSDVASSSAPASSLASPVRKKPERINGAAWMEMEMGWGRWYELEELEAATGGFRDRNVVGEGGYGTVYRGVLASGEVVAVKDLFDHKGQAEKEFKVEVEAIGRVRHKHLVGLVGYCAEGPKRGMVGSRRVEELVDQRIEAPPPARALNRVLLVCLRCIDSDAHKRPKMGQIVHMLEGDEFPFRTVRA